LKIKIIGHNRIENDTSVNFITTGNNMLVVNESEREMVKNKKNIKPKEIVKKSFLFKLILNN
jgi:hypothetical protein